MGNSANSSLYSVAISGNPIVEDGGTVVFGGNISSAGRITNAPGASIVTVGVANEMKPVNSAHVGTTKANNSGNFATQTPGEYVIKGGNKDNLAGVSYTGLFGSCNPIRSKSIKSLLTRKTVLITSWNYATGVATLSESSPQDSDFDAGSYADPTMAVPGNLYFVETGLTPSTKAYNKRTD